MSILTTGGTVSDGVEDAVSLWKNQNEYDMMLVTADRRIFIAQDLEGNLESAEPFTALCAETASL